MMFIYFYFFFVRKWAITFSSIMHFPDIRIKSSYRVTKRVPWAAYAVIKRCLRLYHLGITITSLKPLRTKFHYNFPWIWQKIPQYLQCLVDCDTTDGLMPNAMELRPLCIKPSICPIRRKCNVSGQQAQPPSGAGFGRGLWFSGSLCNWMSAGNELRNATKTATKAAT